MGGVLYWFSYRQELAQRQKPLLCLSLKNDQSLVQLLHASMGKISLSKSYGNEGLKSYTYVQRYERFLAARAARTPVILLRKTLAICICIQKIKPEK
jgi:hypothetical protein